MTDVLPFAPWLSGTLNNSLPANDNSLRLEAILRGAISKSVTAQPGSPTDRDVYIIPAGATGTQWVTFAENDIAMYVAADGGGGTWIALTPVARLAMIVDDHWESFDGSDWVSISDGGGGGSKFVNVALSDMATNLSTGTDKAYWVAPEDGTLDDLWIAVIDPSSSGVVRIDLNKNAGGTVLSTRPSIDATEDTSLTGTAAVISSASFVKGDRFRFDIDDAGTDAKGLQAVIEYTPA